MDSLMDETDSLRTEMPSTKRPLKACPDTRKKYSFTNKTKCASSKSLNLLVLCCGLTLANNCLFLYAQPWGSSFNTAPQRSKNTPSFVPKFRTKVTFEWNGSIANGGATTAADEIEHDLNNADHSNNDTMAGIRARLLAATRNGTLASALAQQMDSMPSFKDFLERNWFFEDEEEGSMLKMAEGEDESLMNTFYARLMETTNNSTVVNTLKEHISSMPSSFKGFLQRGLAHPRLSLAEVDSEETINENDSNVTRTSVGARILASTRNSTIGIALAEQIRSLPSLKDFLQCNIDNSTGNIDWFGTVSTSRRSSCGWSCNMRGGERDAPFISSASITGKSLPANSLDRFAKGLCLNLGKLVAAQCFATWMKSREENWIEQLADRVLSEESALAVKKIRAILTNMEDHGVVDVFSKYTSQDIAVSFYAFYRLQRAAIRYEAIREAREPDRHPEDLMHVLEDLSHYVVYATAAYGWAMDLAFQGKLHLGDEQALMRKTGIEKSDIIKLSLKSKAHLPVYFLVRDRRRKALVLCIRGTWSASDVLTDLCCTAEEYSGPGTSPPLSSSTKQTGQRYCAHHGMLEGAMAVAIEMEEIIQEALNENPDFSLVIVGHSMGAGCASLLATFWEKKFNNVKTYLFGGPCVAPLDSRPTNNTSIINVISEGDPFRCLSLGHVADLSAAVAHLCEDPDLRRTVLKRTEGHVHEMDVEDLEFCWEAMETLRRQVMTHADKMFPPGRIFHVTKQTAKARSFQTTQYEYDSDTEDEAVLDSVSSDEVVIHEVGPAFFREMVISPRMFDISRHLPSLYEDTLQSLIAHERLEGEYQL